MAGGAVTGPSQGIWAQSKLYGRLQGDLARPIMGKKKGWHYAIEWWGDTPKTGWREAVKAMENAWGRIKKKKEF